MRIIQSIKLFHYILFACVFLEILELEVFATGIAHHVWDACVIAIYAYATVYMSHKWHAPWILVFLGGIAWLLDLLGWFWAGFDIETLFWILTHMYLAVLLGRLIFTVDEVSSMEIVDSVALYIIVGIVFANIYGLVLWYHPGALVYTGIPTGERVSYDLILYYSFITQSTVGYGDMAPAHPVTRAVSIVQAIVGVMYIAILISRFVSIYSSAQHNRRSSSNRPGA